MAESTYRVTAAMVGVRADGGVYGNHYRGQLLPKGTPAAALDRLIRLGMVEEFEDVKPTEYEGANVTAPETDALTEEEREELQQLRARVASLDDQAPATDTEGAAAETAEATLTDGGNPPKVSAEDLDKMNLADLRALATSFKVDLGAATKKPEIVAILVEKLPRG